MKCPNCNFEVAENTKFCPECGVKLLDTSSCLENECIKDSSKKKKKKRILLWSIIGSFVVIVGICLLVLFLYDPFCWIYKNDPYVYEDTVEVKKTIQLDANNFYDYFDVSVEYYNYVNEDVDGKYILGVYLSGYYKATVSQRIKITPKSNVISCNDVKINHYANISTAWSYNSSNSGDDSENRNNNDWLITLPSSGNYDNSKSMYYYSTLSEGKCPVPSSSLNVHLIADISGTVTIK